MILRILILASIASFIGCKEHHEAVEQQNDEAKAVASIERYAQILQPLIDHAKLDTLKGKRAATPRLRKACYWLEKARREGFEPNDVITQAQALANPQSKARAQAVLDSLLRNRTILERLGCLDEDGMAKLRRGKAPTITKGPYKGELATVDHIIPRSVCPELDNKLYNLEFMPDTLNKRKSDKVGDRQRQLAEKWHKSGLLSEDGHRRIMGQTR